VYYRAYKGDILGAGSTQNQMLLLTKVPNSSAIPGDLVYFDNNGIYHVGVYIGPNQMIDSPSAHGSLPHQVRVDQINVGFGRVIGYYRYTSSMSGKLDWKYLTGSGVGSTPAVVNGVVYVGSDD
jgi:cell wall-associated NlpC family hydrolase